MEEFRVRHGETMDAARAVFEELCAMVDAFELEREEQREAARAKFELARERRRMLLEKNRRLRDRYIVLLEKYNALAEEVKDRSDSSSGGSSDEHHECSIM